MFRINSQDIEIDFPYKGININAENDISYAKFIQNILVADNKTGCLRYGTNLVSSFQIDPELIFTEGKILEIMSFLGSDGISQKLIYVTYFKKISNIDNFDLKIYHYPELTGWSKAIINVNEINLEDKNYLKKTINDSLKILFTGNGSLSTEIKLLNFDDNTIEFIFSIEKEDIPHPPSILVDPNYELYIERAGIYKINNENEYELLKNELDPLVIVSNINFQGKLIIANGVDPVQIYDGQEILPLYGPVGIPNLNEINVENTQLKFKVPVAGAILMQEDIKIGDKLTIRRQEISDEEVIINSINYGEISAEEREVTIILNSISTQQPISTILYKKLCPSFSYINIVYRRLFALAPGRTYLNKFKAAESSMKVYYAAKEESIEEWFNQKTNSIEFIDLANSSRIPDNLEAITTFYGKTLFLGREEIQVWGGQDPTTHDDGQNISLPDFQWEQTLPIGLMHQKVFLHLPNQLVFLSKYGIVALGIANINGGLIARFDINYQFSNPIDNYISYQLNFIETDRNFRNIKAFLYPYGRFFGFKIQYSCFIYQLNNLEGAWVVFSENFAESSSISYDVTTQNLYLGMPKGELLVYTDKINNRSFMEYGKGSIPWLINYNWNFLQTQWNNKYLYIFSKSLKPLLIDVRIYLDNNETKTINDKIKINQEGVLYDTAKFNSKIYPLNETSYSYELISFSVNSFMIELKGSSSDLFVFNKMFFVGGIN
jgi:hypothetical protein